MSGASFRAAVKHKSGRRRLSENPAHDIGKISGQTLNDILARTFHHDPADILRTGIAQQHTPPLVWLRQFRFGRAHGFPYFRTFFQRRLALYRHADQTLRIKLKLIRQFGKGLPALAHDTQYLKRRQKPVSRCAVIAENEMPCSPPSVASRRRMASPT